MPRFTVKALFFYTTFAALYLAVVGYSVRKEAGFATMIPMLVFLGSLFYCRGYVQRRKK
jgi:hypothetical protein